MTARTLLDFEKAILDLFEQNRITIRGAKTVLWTYLLLPPLLHLHSNQFRESGPTIATETEL